MQFFSGTLFDFIVGLGSTRILNILTSDYICEDPMHSLRLFTDVVRVVANVHRECACAVHQLYVRAPPFDPALA